MDVILVVLSLLITMLAQLFITTAYNKYSKIENERKITGSMVARSILDKNGLSNVRVECVRGHLTDHYDPRKKVVRLSESIYSGNTIAAISVASHECGHAIQDKDNYSFMRLRAALVPFVNFSSYAGYFAILIGCVFQSLNLIGLGIIFELVILLFQLVTLPVEIDASKRALNEIKQNSFMFDNEVDQGKTMLTAAALTYVASVLTTLIQVLRLLSIFAGRRDN